MKRLFLLLLLSCLFESMIYGQTADFTDGCAPLTVSFSPANGMSSYFWDFGDGATSTLQNPSNTYINTASYTVELRETANGPIIGSLIINVFPKPEPALSFDIGKGCWPLSVQFIDKTILNPAITVNSYSWVFGDGGTAIGDTANHTFLSAGNFSPSLQLNTNIPSCNVTKQFNNLIHVSDKPLVGFNTSPDPPTSCTSPLTVSFTNVSTSIHPLSFSWDLGNGTTSTAIDAPTTTYSLDSLYRLKLVAIDTNNCADSVLRVVSVGSPEVDISFPDTICKYTADTIFNNSSNGNYVWDYGVDAELRSTFNGNPIIWYKSSGLKTIRLRITVGPCTVEDSIQVFVENPDASYTSLPDYSCTAPYVINFDPVSKTGSYLWLINDTVTTEQAPAYTVRQAADTNVYHINDTFVIISNLVYFTPFGCKDTMSANDTLFRPTALMFPTNSRGCVPLEVTFYNRSRTLFSDPLVQWEWFFGDGDTLVRSAPDSARHTYTSTGEYWAYLVVTNASGCVDTSYRTLIQVGDTLSPDFSVDMVNICVGDTISFTDLTAPPLPDSIDGWRYSAEGNRLFNCFQDPNPTWVFQYSTGPQDVSLTVDYNGCTSTITKTGLINVDGAIADIDYRNFCDQELTVQFYDSSLNATSVFWDFGDGDTSSLPNPLHTYAATGDYQVILRAEKLGSNCPISFDTVTIHIRDIQAAFSADTLSCSKVLFQLDASASQDVYENCHKGYSWYFTDPLTPPLRSENPVDRTKFYTSGRQEITLIVNDINGCKDTARSFVDVFGVDASFVMDDTSICIPTDVSFTNTTTSDTTLARWIWTFGDGDSAFISDPIHTYDQFQDTNSIVMIAYDTLGCSDTVSAINVMYRPYSIVIAEDNSLCLGDTLKLSATDFTSQGSSLAYSYDFNTGDSSSLQNPSYVYDTAGNYTVNVVVTEISSGCSQNYNKVVTVVDYPIADFSYTNDNFNFICPNENVLFTDSIQTIIPLNYSWEFGNGQNSQLKDPGTIYTTNGNFLTTLIVTLDDPFGCADTISKLIRVKGPIGNFVTDLMGDTICRLDSVLFTIKDTADVEKYTWDFGDGATAMNISPISHQYTFVPPSGQTVAKLILSNIDGSCPVTQDTVITLYEVVADFQRNDGIDTIFCYGPLDLTNKSIQVTSWDWDFGDGNTRSQGDQFTYNYANPGTYNINLSVRNDQIGCNDSITKTVVLHPNPEVFAIGDTLCEGDTAKIAVLTIDSMASYSWTANPMVNFTNTGIASLQAQLTENTNFIVDMVDVNGCTDSDTATAFVIGPLNLSDFDTTIVLGDRINLPVNANAGLYNFSWNPTEGLSCLDCLPPSVQPLEKVSYNLQIVDVLGCFPYDVDFNIDIYPETFIRMPTTFTPNGDGINDVVFVEGWGIRELLSYQIFNRWGEIVFETNNIAVGWDGTYKGEIQNNDVYVYKIRVSTWSNEEKNLEGFLNLSR